MITIDGSYGEGGGQILRSSLALSLVTGKPFCIENIRAGRRKPGLMRQHLTAVNAAVEIGDAEVTGNTIGSQRVTFAPKGIRGWSISFCSWNSWEYNTGITDGAACIDDRRWTI